MKLSQLYESDDRFPKLDDFIEAVRYYLDLCMSAGHNRILWHGSYSINNKRFLYDFKLRHDPRDTPRHIFDAYNDWTQTTYSIQPRRWLFCYASMKTPMEYGKSSAIFPVGKFDWFKIMGEEDFFISFGQKVRSSGGGEQEVMYDMLHNAKSERRIIHGTNFDDVVVPGEEVMIFGSRFYAFDDEDLLVVLRQPLNDESLQKYVDFLNKVLKAEGV